MPQADDRRTLAGTNEDASYQRALGAELERRLVELAGVSNQAFGQMGLGDGIVVFVLFLLVPALAVWLWR